MNSLFLVIRNNEAHQPKPDEAIPVANVAEAKSLVEEKQPYGAFIWHHQRTWSDKGVYIINEAIEVYSKDKWSPSKVPLHIWSL